MNLVGHHDDCSVAEVPHSLFPHVLPTPFASFVPQITWVYQVRFYL